MLVVDLETIINTNESHNQHGRVINERNTKSQSSSQRRSTPKKNPQTIMQEKQKSLIENSGVGDDLDHPKKSIERPHKLPVNKRKRTINQDEEVEEVIPKEDILLEDMELDVNIEDR